MTTIVEVSDLAPRFHEGFAYLQIDLLRKHSVKNRRILAGHGTFTVLIINANYCIF